MKPALDTNPRLDPDDPWRVLDEAAQRRRLEPGRAWKVDRAARELARLCAGWTLRGRSLADLVGLVPHCSCGPKVMPRVELPWRIADARVLDALRSIRSEPGRLAVVESWSGVWGKEWSELREHHIRVPQVYTPDTRGRLEPLSAERGALLARGIEAFRPVLARSTARKLFDQPGLEKHYLEAQLLERGGCFQINTRRDASPEMKELLDAADYEARPGRLLCIVRPDWLRQQEAAAWIELEQLGLCLEGDPCPGHRRLYQVIMAPEVGGSRSPRSDAN